MGAPGMRDALFLAISQSGRSPDLLTWPQAARDDGALTVALVNDTTSPLASDLRGGAAAARRPEKSVAATKSFIASLAAVFQLVAHWSQDQGCSTAPSPLPDDLARRLGDRLAARVPVADGADSLFVVGRGSASRPRRRRR